MIFLDGLISAIQQVLGFSLIPFIVYLIINKKAKGFFNYIGLKKSNRKANLLALLLCLLVVIPFIILWFLAPEFKAIMTHPKSVTGGFRAMGFSLQTQLLVIVMALLKTSLSEEILFRGFIAKRLIAWLGFQAGNIIQAVIFGAIHTLLFLTISDNVLFLTTIFIFPALSAYLKVYLNEKLANGSIIPGWIAHGVGNLISYTVFGFLL